MPRGDKTGPMGMGPMTGRGAGYCNGFATPCYANSPGFPERSGRGFGCGQGRGYRRMFYATGIPGWARYGHPVNTGSNTAVFDEKTFLSNQAEFLNNQLKQVNKQLSELNEEAE